MFVGTVLSEDQKQFRREGSWGIVYFIKHCFYITFSALELDHDVKSKMRKYCKTALKTHKGGPAKKDLVSDIRTSSALVIFPPP